MVTSLIGQLNTLESSGLIRLLTAQPDLEYLFRHALVQDAAYGSLLKRDRKKLHLAVGEALEQVSPDQLDEQAATLAYHFERAEVSDKALHYLTRAGDRARDGYANTEAIAFYQAAIKQVEHILSKANEQPESWRAQLARLFESLADVLELTGQHEAAIIAYEQVLVALARLAQPARIEQARIYRKLGFVFTVGLQNFEAHQAWDLGEESLGPEPTEQVDAWWQEWIEIQVERAWNHYWRFQPDEIQRVCEKVSPIMEQFGTPVQRARVITARAFAGFALDRYLPSSATLALAQEALVAARVTESFSLIFDAQFHLGFMHLWRREFAEADKYLHPLLEPAERRGDAIRLSRCVAYLMMLARMRGQVAETRSYVPQVLKLAWAGKMTNYIYTAKACLAWAAWREGNLAEARAQASAGLEQLQGPLANFPNKWPALWPLLAVATAEQNLVEAVEHARALIHPTQALMPDALTAALETVIAVSEQNQVEEICAQLNHSLKLAQDMGYL